METNNLEAHALAQKLEEGLEDYTSIITQPSIYAATPHHFNYSIFREVHPIEELGQKIENARGNLDALWHVAQDILNSSNNILKLCISTKILNDPSDLQFKEPANIRELSHTSWGKQTIEVAQNYVNEKVSHPTFKHRLQS